MKPKWSVANILLPPIKKNFTDHDGFMFAKSFIFLVSYQPVCIL